MKGISTIIATILLLVMTVGLAGSAYIFISGMLTSRMSKVVSILASSCNGTHITLVVSNDGSETIGADEIKIYVDNQYVGSFGKSISPHNSEVNSTIPSGGTGSRNVLIISPSNQDSTNVWC